MGTDRGVFDASNNNAFAYTTRSGEAHDMDMIDASAGREVSHGFGAPNNGNAVAGFGAVDTGAGWHIDPHVKDHGSRHFSGQNFDIGASPNGAEHIHGGGNVMDGQGPRQRRETMAASLGQYGQQTTGPQKSSVGNLFSLVPDYATDVSQGMSIDARDEVSAKSGTIEYNKWKLQLIANTPLSVGTFDWHTEVFPAGVDEKTALIEMAKNPRVWCNRQLKKYQAADPAIFSAVVSARGLQSSNGSGANPAKQVVTDVGASAVQPLLLGESGSRSCGLTRQFDVPGYRVASNGNINGFAGPGIGFNNGHRFGTSNHHVATGNNLDRSGFVGSGFDPGSCSGSGAPGGGAWNDFSYNGFSPAQHHPQAHFAESHHPAPLSEHVRQQYNFGHGYIPSGHLPQPTTTYSNQIAMARQRPQNMATSATPIRTAAVATSNMPVTQSAPKPRKRKTQDTTSTDATPTTNKKKKPAKPQTLNANATASDTDKTKKPKGPAKTMPRKTEDRIKKPMTSRLKKDTQLRFEPEQIQYLQSLIDRIALNRVKATGNEDYYTVGFRFLLDKQGEMYQHYAKDKNFKDRLKEFNSDQDKHKQGLRMVCIDAGMHSDNVDRMNGDDFKFVAS
ncbi:hypothetical protein EJ08DRAFT_661404 [Tothia fuscella]|uniref:Uncharacterized protein n=1 Tax=Tothia fuscella TaxID=1048955 RepID=A0A9P4NR00_9PEZI|nr:hypothetical protein EJ08DRAFT_661404 [Tothia fuscella]